MRSRTVFATVAVAALLVGGASAASAVDAHKTTAPTPKQLAAASTPEGKVNLKNAAIGQGTLRVAGNDRYETSVAISKLMWDYDSTAVVYLASGENYPDALSMGPSTANLGPLLLTPKNSLAPVVAEELKRLNPCLVVVVGGPGTVSDAVAQQADTYTNPASCDDVS